MGQRRWDLETSDLLVSPAGTIVPVSLGCSGARTELGSLDLSRRYTLNDEQVDRKPSATIHGGCGHGIGGLEVEWVRQD
jgi:hypothetical protein